MQPRLAALLFALGLADLAYVNLGLGRELFPDVAAPAVPPAPREPAPVPERAPPRLAPEPSPSPEPLPQPVTHNDVPHAPTPMDAVLPPPATAPELEAEPADTTRVAPYAGVITFPDTASAWLTGRGREEVLALAARLRAHPELRIRVIGHADARGTREFNLDLGARRARAVTELLARAGVPRQQVELESRGEDEPRAVGASEPVWAANRRVEVRIETMRNETP